MRIGIPIVVYSTQYISLLQIQVQKRGTERKAKTYIDRQIQQVETTRIWFIISLLIDHPSGNNTTRIQPDIELATGQHTHQQIRNMHQHAPEHLFTDIEEPDLEGSLGPFTPSFVD